MNIPQDFKDLLAAFASEDLRFLLIGGYAVSFHATPRTTKDIDFLVGRARTRTLNRIRHS